MKCINETNFKPLSHTSSKSCSAVVCYIPLVFKQAKSLVYTSATYLQDLGVTRSQSTYNKQIPLISSLQDCWLIWPEHRSTQASQHPSVAVLTNKMLHKFLPRLTLNTKRQFFTSQRMKTIRRLIIRIHRIILHLLFFFYFPI